MRKGIILAGGSGSRLAPLTRIISKQLLPVYDLPMIYYPLSVLMRAKVRDILLITTAADQTVFERLLGNGVGLGLRISYAIQIAPCGIADAYLVGERFLSGDKAILILGDNFLYGPGLDAMLADADAAPGATIFVQQVSDPARFGTLILDDCGKVVGLEEKSSVPSSDLGIAGLYLHDGRAPDYAKALSPSSRGELEITDLNRCYLERGELFVGRLGNDISWFDMGTHESLFRAGEFVRNLIVDKGIWPACLEQIAFKNGWIGREEVIAHAPHGYISYNNYLKEIIV
jgi:glucose-1-phosphate thymidylyltransferase